MKILHLDIETTPGVAYIWDAFGNDYIPIERLHKEREVLCWGARWDGTQDVLQGRYDGPGGRAGMLNAISGLLNEADAVVHYNGSKFDIPMLNTSFLRYKLSVPSPYKQVDLRSIMKQKFRFLSNKLDWISRQLELGEKIKHEGFELWTKCMAGDKKAMATMLAYNKQDVILLEKLYKRLLPWIDLHPNMGLYHGVDACPACVSKHFHARGIVTTHNAQYQRFQCQDCGKWFRGSKPIHKKRSIGTRNVRP